MYRSSGFHFGLSLAIALVVFPYAAGAAETGAFLSVKGKVSVKSASGENTPAKAGSEVSQGDKLSTEAGGEAVIRFFDGSQVSLKPGTEVEVDRLEKPSATDKALRFKLLVGRLLAKVQKLVSSKSSFEIEAGGVVCGVRGTEFSMDYDSAKDQLELHVVSGMVSAKAGGVERNYNAGESAQFNHGSPRDPQSGLSTGKREEKPVEFTLGLSQDPALRDLKALFGRQLMMNHDSAFTDPAVGGTALIPTGAFVPPAENVP